MPVHDWSRVDANLFHDFHQTWCINIRNALNAGLLPAGFSALVEQHAAGLVPDVLALQRRRRTRPNGGALATAAPQVKHVMQTKPLALAARGNRIAIRHRLGEVVCVIEIVSPGNKGGQAALRNFVEKTQEFLEAGVNVLIVDLFPPTSRDPQGIHKAIWDEVNGDRDEIDGDPPFKLPADKPLTLAAYVAGDLSVDLPTTAYVQPIGVGDPLPDMPAYLDADQYVPVPLESTYQATWATCPADMRYLVEHGSLPDE